MAFDFPSSPSAGQTYTPAAGMPTYTWNGVSWDVLPASVSPGTLVELSRQVVTSAVAGVNFTGIDSTYDEYELHWYGVMPSAGAGDLGLRVSQDGGTTWKSGASDYQTGAIYTPYDITGGGNVGMTGAYVRLSGNVQVLAGWGCAGKLTLFAPSNTNYRKQLLYKSYYIGTVQSCFDGWGSYSADVNAYNAVRFFHTVGNIASGTFVLYGVSKTAVVPGTPAAGSRVLIRSQTISSAVAQVDFTAGIDSAYDEYELVMRGVKLNTDGSVALRISQDGGATWKSGTDYAYAAAAPAASGSVFFPGTGNAMVVSGLHAASSTAPLVSVIKFHDPSNATIRKPFLVHTYHNHPSNGHSSWIGHGLYTTDNGAINGLRILNTGGAGTLTAGTFSLFGMKK